MVVVVVDVAMMDDERSLRACLVLRCRTHNGRATAEWLARALLLQGSSGTRTGRDLHARREGLGYVPFAAGGQAASSSTSVIDRAITHRNASILDLKLELNPNHDRDLVHSTCNWPSNCSYDASLSYVQQNHHLHTYLLTRPDLQQLITPWKSTIKCEYNYSTIDVPFSVPAHARPSAQWQPEATHKPQSPFVYLASVQSRRSLTQPIRARIALSPTPTLTMSSLSSHYHIEFDRESSVG